MWICWDWGEVLYLIVVGNVYIRNGFLTIFFAKCLGLEMGMTTLLSNCFSLVKQCIHLSYFAHIQHLNDKRVLSSRNEKCYLVGLLMSPCYSKNHFSQSGVQQLYHLIQ